MKKQVLGLTIAGALLLGGGYATVSLANDDTATISAAESITAGKMDRGFKGFRLSGRVETGRRNERHPLIQLYKKGQIVIDLALLH
jgi:hypothetical protein